MPAKPIDEIELQQRAQAILAAAPGCKLEPITPLQGGASSVTFQTSLTHNDGRTEKVVLKVAPAGLEPTKNRDVLRQARLQTGLQGTGVPVPRVLAEHSGAPPEVPPFFVMAFEQGDCVEPNSLPVDRRLPPEEVRGRELEAARILGVLHSLDPVRIGIGDEPEISPAAELDRWAQSFASCDEDLRAGSDDVRDRLAGSTPTAGSSTLIHGDYRLGNALSMGTTIVSVIDWEIWARADPRVDLSWFLMMANPDEEMRRPIAEGMPTNAELLDTYERARGVAVQDIEWFAALVRYKQAAIAALIARNARRRGEDTTITSGSSGLLASARKLLGIN
jgi:aminoglycoside phosphotransferase (APT) family kinase protein